MRKLFVLFAVFILMPVFCWAESCDPEWVNCYKIDGEWHLDCTHPCTDYCNQINGCIVGEIPYRIYDPIKDTCRCWCECTPTTTSPSVPEFSNTGMVIALIVVLAVSFMLFKKKK